LILHALQQRLVVRVAPTSSLQISALFVLFCHLLLTPHTLFFVLFYGPFYLPLQAKQ
jgi:hypothetical protein